MSCQALSPTGPRQTLCRHGSPDGNASTLHPGSEGPQLALGPCEPARACREIDDIPATIALLHVSEA